MMAQLNLLQKYACNIAILKRGRFKSCVLGSDTKSLHLNDGIEFNKTLLKGKSFANFFGLIEFAVAHQHLYFFENLFFIRQEMLPVQMEASHGIQGLQS